MSPTPAKSPLKLLMNDLNGNTILLLVGFAGLYYLSGIFITKEIYYRDQVRLENTLKQMNEKQEAIYTLLLKQQQKGN